MDNMNNMNSKYEKQYNEEQTKWEAFYKQKEQEEEQRKQNWTEDKQKQFAKKSEWYLFWARFSSISFILLPVIIFYMFVNGGPIVIVLLIAVWIYSFVCRALVEDHQKFDREEQKRKQKAFQEIEKKKDEEKYGKEYTDFIDKTVRGMSDEIDEETKIRWAKERYRVLYTEPEDFLDEETKEKVRKTSREKLIRYWNENAAKQKESYKKNINQTSGIYFDEFGRMVDSTNYSGKYEDVIINDEDYTETIIEVGDFI